MKKIKFLLLAAVAALSLSGCNMSVGVGNYNFKKVHIIANSSCYEISSWHDNEMGIEVKTKDYGSIYLSEGTYILIGDKCPICEK